MSTRERQKAPLRFAMVHVCSEKLMLFALVSLSVSSLWECTVDLNVPELQYLSDHLNQEECRKLVAFLHFHTYSVPVRVRVAETKLPRDASCLDLLLHWNSAEGEGKGETHKEVCHRLNQIGRRDLSEWLSRTVFHQLGKELDESLTNSVSEEASRRPARVTEPPKQVIVDEAPWLNLDSVLALLIVLALSAFGCGILYLVCLAGVKIYRTNKQRKYTKMAEEQMAQIKRRTRDDHRQKATSASEGEKANLVSKKGAASGHI